MFVQDAEKAAVPPKAALSALGGAVAFLQEVLLDRAILPIARFDALPQVRGNAIAVNGQVDDDVRAPMVLDSTALENLEVTVV